MDHIDAIEDAKAAGLRGILFKDHYYSVTPTVELLRKRYAADGKLALVSGIALNNTVGGLNRYAVDHCLKLGGQIVWMPTFSSANHIDHHHHDKDFDKKFPTTKEKMLQPTPLRVTDGHGKLLDEAKFILDMIADADVILSSGHLHISEIWPLFEEAKARGVKRLLVNHPTYVVDATIADIAALAQITWGTSPAQSVGIDAAVPDPAAEPDLGRRQAMTRALDYMGLTPGTRLDGLPIDQVFIGSCTNARISDLRLAASIARGRKVAQGVRAMVVPGSTAVKRQAEAEGLDRIFQAAGFEWHESACSLCASVNADVVPPRQRCVATSNRNFEGRQGREARTHLASPATAAAAAVSGCVTDPRRLLEG
ncbi:MAG: DUF6282 family protein [Pseudomonadota bacterium]